MRILLIEDDECIAKSLEVLLAKEHYAVDVAVDGELGWQFIESFTYDLILLDIVLPKIDGITLCRQIRDYHYQTPVLLLTARNSSTDRIIGLDAGADDYMVKPFELPELLARMRVLLRRGSSPVMPLLEWNHLQIDPASCQVTYRDQVLHLTPKEYRLLELFLRKPQHVFTRSAILEHLWSIEEAPNEDTVTAHIKGVRHKLKQVGAPANFIETVYGIGYRLRQAKSDAALQPITQPVNSRPVNSRPANSQPVNSQRISANPETVIDPTAHLSASHTQQMQSALQGLWGKYIFKNREHVRVLADSIAVIQNWAAVDQTSDQTADQMMTTEQWQQAQVAAHKLVGTLGLFGRPQGSQLALSLENFFRAGQLPSPTELLVLVQQVQELDAIVQHNPQNSSQDYPHLPTSIPSTSPTPSPNSSPTSSSTPATAALTGLPLCQDFVLIGLDHDATWAEQMGKLAKNCFTQFSSIEQFAAYVVSYKQRHESSSPTQFQLLLLNLSLADFSSQQTAMLKTLTEQIPPALILVCTDQASLDLRIQLAQAGVYAVLPKLSPQQVWSLVKHLRLVDATLPKRVLTVDDDPQVLDMLQSSLEAWGLQVSCLEHSSQFWETLHSCAPDLLILDVEMPHYSGIDLCRTVRNTLDWQNLPILFLTAHTDIATLQDAVNAGANALIYKSAPQVDIVHHVLVKLQHANRNFF